MAKPSPSRRRKKNRRNALITGIALIAAVAAVYIAVTVYYQTHFLPGTEYGGVSVGGKTAAQAEKALESSIGSYQLVITDESGNNYRIKGTDIGLSLSAQTGSSIEDALSAQKPYLWVSSFFVHPEENSASLSVSYDSSKLESALSSLDCFSKADAVSPQDAYITYSDDSQQFEIVPEQAGNTPELDKVLEKAEKAISALQLSISLTDEDYSQASVTSADATLASAVKAANNYVSKTITYETYGEKDSDDNFSIEKSRIASWVQVSDDGQVSLNEDAIASYVQTLASKYNTYGDNREFTTSLGDTISIGGGDYGWVIDKDKEAAQIVSDLESDETNIEREPCWEQTAKAPGPDDIGNTYLEIDYTNQHFYYYVDGQLKLDSDIVSGNTSIGNGSPDGIYKIVYKATDQTLTGEDYESPVDYFMPFAYNVGFHDASWRSTFGGEIYKTSGSHGCINLPSDVAKQLYQMVEVGTPVVAYYRDPVVLTSTNAKTSNAYSYQDEDSSDSSSSSEDSSSEDAGTSSTSSQESSTQ